MIKVLRKLFRRSEGATAIEYGLIAALIAVAIIGGAEAIGGSIGGLFTSVGDQLADKIPATAPAPAP